MWLQHLLSVNSVKKYWWRRKWSPDLRAVRYAKCFILRNHRLSSTWLKQCAKILQKCKHRLTWDWRVQWRAWRPLLCRAFLRLSSWKLPSCSCRWSSCQTPHSEVDSQWRLTLRSETWQRRSQKYVFGRTRYIISLVTILTSLLPLKSLLGLILGVYIHTAVATSVRRGWAIVSVCTQWPSNRGVDPYGTGGTRPPNIWTGGHYHECPPQYLWSNISYFLSMQYFLDKLKEFLVLTAGEKKSP